MQNNIKDMNLSDFILVLFEKMREKEVKKVVGRTKLQKLICIIAHEFNLPTRFDYFPYTYGPYSSSLQNEIDTLVTFNLMEEKVSREKDYLKYGYRLTPKGVFAARQILEKTDRPIEEIFDKMAERTAQLNKMALGALIDNAYQYAGKH